MSMQHTQYILVLVVNSDWFQILLSYKHILALAAHSYALLTWLLIYSVSHHSGVH